MQARRYFEGWYFKHVSKKGGETLAVIPGVSFSDRGSRAFVQIIDGATGRSRWFPFPLSDFSADRHGFGISIGANRFSLEGIELHLEDSAGRVEAKLGYHDSVPLPPRPFWPNIMGPYSFAPFMECYHAVGSLDHRVEGSAELDATRIDFSGGSGYMEKDWGRSMPSAWIWAQSNTFPTSGDSFLFSLARVPWLGSSFPGFFALLRSGGVIRRFATYTGASLKSLSLEGRSLAVEIEDRRYSLRLRGSRSHEGSLLAPVNGAMDRRIGESIDAELELRLETRDGAPVFEGRGRDAGLEVVGDIGTLAPN